MFATTKELMTVNDTQKVLIQKLTEFVAMQAEVNENLLVHIMSLTRRVEALEAMITEEIEKEL